MDHQVAQQLQAGDDIIREHLAALAMHSYHKYTRSGNRQDIDEAAELARRSIDTGDVSVLSSLNRLKKLGIILTTRYERTGEMGNLEEAITAARQAVDLSAADHPARAVYFNNFGSMLHRRYQRTGEMENLEEAIGMAKQAVNTTSIDHPDRANRLNNLGNMLQSWFEWTGETDNLEEAIAVARQALDSTPVDHPDRAGYLSNLGNMLQSQQAVNTTPADHPDRATCLNNLGNKLQSRYERTGEMANLEEAIAVARQAVDLTPADHPDLVACLNNLGTKLESRFGRTGDSGDLEESSSCLYAAWSCETGIPFHRVKAAARCVALLAGQSRIDAAIQLGQAVLDLLPVVNTQLLERSDQQFVMTTFAGVAANVCACLACNCQLVDGKDDLSSLRSDYYQIACRYERLRTEINTTAGDREQHRVETATRRRAALAELDNCIDDIRGCAGYERFLLDQTYWMDAALQTIPHVTTDQAPSCQFQHGC
ncbi:hypothetical protein PCL_09507 [Purpureocillium lilacinum]|uniref:Uncharacterized protein n=1 Tax=Purpureocillium lilacinum TaxID=33203 RepID=A0A2U3DQS2_PURLI|nr:hypothetical protein PCL_09507 [Purpureocillium lilacinum]